MPKITRATQKIFGSSAGANQIAKFGSLASGSPSYTTDPATIQSLSNYLVGWFNAIIGANSPAIEDMNALFYLITYQLGYLMQEGIPEWDSGTTYYIGSWAQDGSGNPYVSLQNNNTNNALTNSSFWVPVGKQTFVAIDPAVTPTYTLSAGDNGKIFLILTANGACTFTLPTATANFSFTLKDKSGSANINAITINRASTEQIEGLASSFVFEAQYGELGLICDGTNWWINNG